MIDPVQLDARPWQAPRIAPVDDAIRADAYRRLDTLTKPLGSLGQLEPLAAQLCAIQRSLHPSISHPLAIVFGADHGAADRGVSAYPKAVTVQMIKNFLVGGAAISVLARQQNFDLFVVDAGVDGDCGQHPALINAKLRPGTRDYVSCAAMTESECQQCLSSAADILQRVAAPGCNLLIPGEIGIGNTASAALLMHGLTGIALAECVGRGTGLDDEGLKRKLSILTMAAARRALPSNPIDLLSEFGGYEIAMLVGVMLAAAARRMTILVDGFTVSVAAALAARIDPAVKGYLVFAHCSAERGHRVLLDLLGAQPLLNLSMRLGEGTGSAVALSIVRSATALFNDMATFESAGVSEKN